MGLAVEGEGVSEDNWRTKLLGGSCERWIHAINGSCCDEAIRKRVMSKLEVEHALADRLAKALRTLRERDYKGKDWLWLEAIEALEAFDAERKVES